MSHGKASRPVASRPPSHGGDDEALSSRPFSLPPGYYERYGIRPLESAQGSLPAGRWGARRGPSIPRGLLEYYGIIPRPTPDGASGPSLQEGYARAEPAQATGPEVQAVEPTAASAPAEPTVVQATSEGPMFFAQATGTGASLPTVQRHERWEEGGTPAGVEAVVDAVRRVGTTVEPGDFSDALQALTPLSMSEMLQALTEVDRIGQLERFWAFARSRAAPRVAVACTAVLLARGRGASSPSTFHELSQWLPQVPAAEQSAVVLHVARAAGKQAEERTIEGMMAAMQSGEEMRGATAAAMQSVPRGPWKPPGGEPIPLYIGNQAHEGIAFYYQELHRGELVFANFDPISRILGEMLGANVGAVGKDQLALRPDITNVTLRELYEVKPLGAAAEAATELALYLGIFELAGVPMAAGSSTAPGTAGVIPAPDGHYLFESPAPGIILYQYRKGDYEPQPEPAREREPAPQTQTQTGESFMEMMHRLTGLTGLALILYIIVSEGSRAIPVRNFVPAP